MGDYVQAMTELQLGLFGINMFDGADPAAMLRIAQHAEAAGFDSVWTGEHIVLPDPQAPPSPLPPQAPMIDSAVALSYVAAGTTSIKLGTGIIILPQREPAVLAKSLASLDHVSGGRLMFGLGVGYLEPEMLACSTPMERRGERADEYVAAMRALWTGDAASFDGEFVSFTSVSANPKPAQADLHTVVGGHSKRASRRAVELAHGWYGFMRDLDTTAADLAQLAAAEEAHGRPADLGRLEISITPPRRPSADDIVAYAELGVDRLILQPGSKRTEAEVREYIDSFAASR